VEAGAKLEVRGRFGYPLRAAAVAGKPKIIKYLLEKGADPNSEDQELGDALQAAANKGDVQVMLILLDNKADVNGSWGEFGDTTSCRFWWPRVSCPSAN
jgi:ankyrin repeat protein